MAIDKLIQAKSYRLEELRKYQAYYGPNTPYPVIVEINRLETELQRLLRAGQTRATPASRKPQPKKQSKKKQPKPPVWQVWRMSQATTDLIATIAFIGLVFLLGSIVFAAYVQTRPGNASAALPAAGGGYAPAAPTLRPTFTPTGRPEEGQAVEEAVAPDSQSFLPTPKGAATDVPTPVPTLTPTSTLEPTVAPPPTDTPVPINTPLPPPPTAAPAAAPAAAASPTEPPAAPEPSFPFMMAEQGNREFQKTTYPAITIYVAVVSEGNVPMGGYKVIGDHVPSGLRAESDISTWDWSVVNCLDCDYIKQGNLKFEPGPFMDGIWNIYLADSGGNPQSPVVSLTYSSDPQQWVWDFVIFRRKNG